MKKFKVIAQSLTGEDTKKEYVVEAENKDLARGIAMDLLLKEEMDGLLLDSPGLLITTEEVNLKL